MDRAEFLKILGVTAASTFIGTLPSRGNAKNSVTLPDDRKSHSQEAVVDKPVTAIVIGAGSRGRTYAGYAGKYPKSLKIVGVSDILEDRKLAMARQFDVASEHQFGDWSEVFKVAKFADAVIISTPDDLHYKPCMKALEMGYDVLLEKPIAQTAQECKDIAAQAHRYNRIVGVCHVLRYAPYFIALKRLIDSGELGEVLSIQHFEPIAYHHMAHSYVRGNWHDSKASTPIIVAKSCHDLDLIRWMTGRRCEKISAFGSLNFFKPENAPKGSADRCLNCSVERECAYSAIKIYMEQGRHVHVFDLPADREKQRECLIEKLKTTDYGRCVFRCKNDQCDHFVTTMQFEGGLTAAFSMEAFTSYEGRRTRIMGTKGDVVGDMTSFTHTDFLTGKQTVWNEDISDLPGYGAHGGGDWGIMRDFVLAVGNHDDKYLSSKIDVSVESHVMGFLAEESRVKGKVIKIKE